MPTVLGGLVGGLVATVAMSVVMRATGGGPPPSANLLAKFRGGSPDEYALPGMVLHLLYGTGAGAVFVPLVDATGAAVEGLAAWTAAGLVWGVVLLVGGAVGWVRGVIGMEPDRETLVGFAVVHVVYGLVLGAFVGAELLA
jgi:hypothetical protein